MIGQGRFNTMIDPDLTDAKITGFAKLNYQAQPVVRSVKAMCPKLCPNWARTPAGCSLMRVGPGMSVGITFR